MRYFQTIILVGLILSASLYLLVLIPVNRLSDLKPISDGTGGFYPNEHLGAALKGALFYRSLGCYYCHTRLVKPYEFGTDYERGWGIRRLVARDFLADSLILFGYIRLAPDLANIGLRKPEKFSIPWKYSSTNQTEQIGQFENRLLTILYNPKLLNPKSIMPSFRFLFNDYVTNAQPFVVASDNPMPKTLSINGQTVIPTEPAIYIVEYLKSMKSEYPLFEAPPPPDPSRFIRRTTEITNVLQSVSP